MMDMYKDPEYMAQFMAEVAKLAAEGALPGPVTAQRAQQPSAVVPLSTAPIALPAWPMELSSLEKD